MPTRLKLANLRIGLRLIVMGLAFALPVGVLLYLFVDTINANIRFSEMEKYGDEYLRPLEKILVGLGRGRVATGRGVADPAATREVDEGFEGLADVDKRLGRRLQVTDEGLRIRKREHVRPETIRREWQELKASREGGAQERYVHLISDIRTLYTHVGDTSNLILDPDLDTYYMMDITLLAMPQIEDRVQEMAAYVDVRGHNGALTGEERVQLRVFAAMLQADLERVKSSLGSSLNEDQNFLGINTEYQRTMPPAERELEDALTTFVRASQGLASEPPTLTADQYATLGDEALRVSHKFWTTAVNGLDRLLTTRVGSYTRRKVISLVLAGLALALAWVLVFVIIRTITRPLHRAVQVSDRISGGDLTHGLEVESQDEIGMLAGSMNEMVTNLRRVVDNIQEASVQVESSAGEISGKAKLITEGAKSQALAAEETSSSMEEMAASIQSVADNAGIVAQCVDETSSSITEMVASIEQVAKSSGTLASTVADASATIEEMTASTDQAARNLAPLAETVAETSVTIEEMASSIEAVARNAEVLTTAASRASQTVSEMAGAVNDVAKIAQEADRISRKASDDARTGDVSVTTTIEGMRTISETMENTARVITSLGRRSEEIGKILEVIEDIADQTNLLALNAAIEAARAGEAGRGFAVVADEVRKLAERSVEATREIGEFIRQVQQETTDAVETAKAGASETKEGIRLADQAGLALRRIIDSVTRSSQLMAEIASSTARQSKASGDALMTVSEMNSATEQVTTAVKEQATGSKQIRQAMEHINKIMTEAAHSTREQAAGGRQVRLAVENINKIVAQLGIATKDQADGSRQIIRSVENMNRMTQQVSHATAEQKLGGELVVKAMENISETARGNLSNVEDMSNATANLAHQAENLAKLIAVFRSK